MTFLKTAASFFHLFYQPDQFPVCSKCVPKCRQQLYAGALDTTKARQALQKLSSNGTPLSACATDLLSMVEASQEEDLNLLSKQFKGEPPAQQSVITCMTTIKKAYDEVSHCLLSSSPRCTYRH